jgi:hypothetical protein
MQGQVHWEARLKHPYGDPWESPTADEPDERDLLMTTTLEVENGELVR